MNSSGNARDMESIQVGLELAMSDLLRHMVGASSRGSVPEPSSRNGSDRGQGVPLPSAEEVAALNDCIRSLERGRGAIQGGAGSDPAPPRESHQTNFHWQPRREEALLNFAYELGVGTVSRQEVQEAPVVDVDAEGAVGSNLPRGGVRMVPKLRPDHHVENAERWLNLVCRGLGREVGLSGPFDQVEERARNGLVGETFDPLALAQGNMPKDYKFSDVIRDYDMVGQKLLNHLFAPKALQAWHDRPEFERIIERLGNQMPRLMALLSATVDALGRAVDLPDTDSRGDRAVSKKAVLKSLHSDLESLTGLAVNRSHVLKSVTNRNARKRLLDGCFVPPALRDTLMNAPCDGPELFRDLNGAVTHVYGKPALSLSKGLFSYVEPLVESPAIRRSDGESPSAGSSQESPMMPPPPPLPASLVSAAANAAPKSILKKPTMNAEGRNTGRADEDDLWDVSLGLNRQRNGNTRGSEDGNRPGLLRRLPNDVPGERQGLLGALPRNENFSDVVRPGQLGTRDNPRGDEMGRGGGLLPPPGPEILDRRPHDDFGHRGALLPRPQTEGFERRPLDDGRDLRRPGQMGPGDDIRGDAVRRGDALLPPPGPDVFNRRPDDAFGLRGTLLPRPQTEGFERRPLDGGLLSRPGLLEGLLPPGAPVERRPLLDSDPSGPRGGFGSAMARPRADGYERRPVDPMTAPRIGEMDRDNDYQRPRDGSYDRRQMGGYNEDNFGPRDGREREYVRPGPDRPLGASVVDNFGARDGRDREFERPGPDRPLGPSVEDNFGARDSRDREFGRPGPDRPLGPSMGDNFGRRDGFLDRNREFDRPGLDRPMGPSRDDTLPPRGALVDDFRRQDGGFSRPEPGPFDRGQFGSNNDGNYGPNQRDGPLDRGGPVGFPGQLENRYPGPNNDGRRGSLDDRRGYLDREMETGRPSGPGDVGGASGSFQGGEWPPLPPRVPVRAAFFGRNARDEYPPRQGSYDSGRPFGGGFERETRPSPAVWASSSSRGPRTGDYGHFSDLGGQVEPRGGIGGRVEGFGGRVVPERVMIDDVAGGNMYPHSDRGQKRPSNGDFPPANRGSFRRPLGGSDFGPKSYTSGQKAQADRRRGPPRRQENNERPPKSSGPAMTSTPKSQQPPKKKLNLPSTDSLAEINNICDFLENPGKAAQKKQALDENFQKKAAEITDLLQMLENGAPLVLQ